MQSKLDGPYRPPANGREPEKLVVFLHGVGADGNDLIGLADPLGEVLPSAGFISPNAPEPCDMAPFGYQWFSLQDRDPRALLRGVETADPVLGAFIDAQKDRFGLADGDIAILSFSQGTMTALHHAPRRAGQLAGIAAFSGALIGGEGLAAAPSRPPVLLVHGDQDPVVPFAAMGAAEQALNGAGFQVTAVARPGLGHGIDPEGLGLAARFLQSVL